MCFAGGFAAGTSRAVPTPCTCIRRSSHGTNRPPAHGSENSASSDEAVADMALRPRRRPPPGCRRRARRLLPHHHAHPVRDAIVHEGDGGGIHGVAVQLGLRDPPAAVLRVGNGDVIASAAETPDHGILGPGRGDAGIQLEARTVALEAEDALHARAVHPPRGARVPRPTGAGGVRGAGGGAARGRAGAHPQSTGPPVRSAPPARAPAPAGRAGLRAPAGTTPRPRPARACPPAGWPRSRNAPPAPRPGSRTGG